MACTSRLARGYRVAKPLTAGRARVVTVTKSHLLTAVVGLAAMALPAAEWLSMWQGFL